MTFLERSNRTALKIHVLGDFRLSVCEAPIILAPCSERLLAALSLSNDLSRTAISAQLWPELDESMARRCLRSALWRLPKVDGLSPVASSGDRLYLNSFVQVDIIRLRDQLDRWLPGEAPPIGIAALSKDLLPTWYDEWLVMERESQRQARLHALERISAWYVSVQRFDSAIEAALQAIAGDPLRESAHRCLIQAHLAEGNMSEARRQFQSYMALLTDAELPTEVSPRMRDLMLTIPLFARASKFTDKNFAPG